MNEPASAAAILKTLPGFVELHEEELESLASLGKPDVVGQGRLLISDNEEADALFILLEGGLRVFRVEKDGRETDIAYLAPGSVIGELALLTNSRRTANVAATSESRVLCLPKEAFAAHNSRYSGFSALIARQLADRLIESNRQLSEKSHALMDELIDLLKGSGMQGQDEEIVISKRPSLNTLAAQLGIPRKEVLNMLARLEADGILVTSGRSKILRLVQ